MAIVVVGGHTRNIGKTAVVAGLIAALPEFDWTAFKITQSGGDISSSDRKSYRCETYPHSMAISEERDPSTGTDSARFLAAGAARSFWIRTRQGQLADAMPRIRKELATSTNAILESNSILQFLQPDLYLTVLDPANRDFKSSARKFLARADAVLWSGDASRERVAEADGWPEDLLLAARSKPQFFLEPTTHTCAALTEFVARHLSPSAHRGEKQICEEKCAGALAASPIAGNTQKNTR